MSRLALLGVCLLGCGGDGATTTDADVSVATEVAPDISPTTSPPEVTVEPEVVADVEPEVIEPDTVEPEVIEADTIEDVEAEVVEDIETDVVEDVQTGPVAVGVYTYSALPAFGLIDPPSAAWHPDGSYALVLDGADQVFRYDADTHALTLAASAGTTVKWRTIVFSPDGVSAVLLANVVSPAEGRIYVWDDATSTLTLQEDEAYVGGTYESIAWRPDAATARVLGAKRNAGSFLASIWTFDVTLGRSGLAAKPTNAGCEDLAWASDASDAPAVAVTCGVDGVTLFHLDGTGAFVEHAQNASNTSRIAARPQGDYALAIGWSGQRVYRFERGVWSTAFASPTLPGIFQIGFSGDGRRALILGGYGGSGVGQLYEFRHDAMQQGDFADVSIPDFDLPPYNAESQVELNDVAWRPGCDGGLIVGGSDTVTSQRGYVIRFSVDNGTPCPD